MASNGAASHEMRQISEVSQIKQSAAAVERNATPSPAPPSDNTIVGSWLCDAGPYQKYIEALSASNPGLKKADPNNGPGPLKRGNALVVLLDAPASGQPQFTRQEFINSTELGKHFQRAEQNHDRRRIYLMEGLAPDFVAAVGGHFFMNPSFFQRQERTCVWSNEFTPVSDALPQPSLLNPDESFHLQYCELRQFNKALQNRYFFCERSRRHVGMTAPRHKEETTVGILRRKVSWWCRKTERGGWDVVILCDPQLHHLSPHPKEVLPGDDEPRDIENVRDTLKNGPFQGGYNDFLPTLPYQEALRRFEEASEERREDHPHLHPHKSMMRDLIYYYERHSSLLEEEGWEKPETSSIFLKKIVAAHYLQLVDYIKVMLPSLELKLTTAWVEEQEQWKSLQTISRRCGNYRDDLEDALLSLGYPVSVIFDNPTKLGYTKWTDCEKDYQYAYLRLKILKERADNLTTSMTGLASIAGNRQNLEEAKRVKRLNILALLFIPLAYTSSLFSMQDDYAPNHNKFWVYWVSAFGVVAFTSLITFFLDRALDEEANWNWKKVDKIKTKTHGLYDLVRR